MENYSQGDMGEDDDEDDGILVEMEELDGNMEGLCDPLDLNVDIEDDDDDENDRGFEIGDLEEAMNVRVDVEVESDDEGDEANSLRDNSFNRIQELSRQGKRLEDEIGKISDSDVEDVYGFSQL